MIYPFWNSVVLSFNDGEDAIQGGITFWPREFSLENYKYVFQDTRLGKAYLVTIFRTVLGTLVTVFFTSCFAFGLTKKKLIGRKYYMWIAVFTMYFGGGLIPFYIVIRNLGLINSIWVYIFVIGAHPAVISVFHMIIFRTFFMNIPSSLEDSAKIDGAGYYTVFFKIVVPVSTPVFATLILFNAVNHWNAWFDGAIFVTNPNIVPMQTLLRQILNSNAFQELLNELEGNAAEELSMSRVTTRTLSMATMVFATLPILFAYPFLQRFFVHGLMIGSLKG
jgi:putative aldouronate transport system permease protein